MRHEQGRLADAEHDAADVLRRDHISTVVRLPALLALAGVRTRRGDAGAQELLDEALERALSTGELQRIAPVANVRAEAAWLAGDGERVRAEVMRAWPLALAGQSPWDIGRLAVWLQRADVLDGADADVNSDSRTNDESDSRALRDLPAPFAAVLAGRWREAAEEFRKIGCPYECALALAEGDESAQRNALAMLEDMGARPAAALVRSRLLHSGVRGLPRGPRPSTRTNPGNLTNRQLDVLALLAEGLSNREIARRLFLSTRTVDHHVSALLRKLDVRTRARAARAAREMTIGVG
jgi:DNA-binding CsgD family transcriptional regulator